MTNPLGTHLIIDVWGAAKTCDEAYIRTTLLEMAAASGATVLGLETHVFSPHGGLTGIALLAESHISFHSWPEHDFAAFDIFMCGVCNPHCAVEVLQRRHIPQTLQVQEIKRGHVNSIPPIVNETTQKYPVSASSKGRESWG